jgi:hypothetical protein
MVNLRLVNKQYAVRTKAAGAADAAAWCNPLLGGGPSGDAEPASELWLAGIDHKRGAAKKRG